MANAKNSQCWVTSHNSHKKLVGDAYSDRKTHINKGEDVLKHMGYIESFQPSVTTIELKIFGRNAQVSRELIRRKYNIRSRFWIPQVFCHSFNIIITKDKKAMIGQSWFMEMPYKIIETFDNERDLKNWLVSLEYAVKLFSEKPRILFYLFHYPMHSDYKIKNVVEYITREKPKLNIFTEVYTSVTGDLLYDDVKKILE